jgi:hypothetical protein
MKTISSFKTALALGALLLALSGATSARADQYTISLDTSALVGNVAGPFYLDFQSIYGSGADQTIMLSNFILTGGGFVAGTEAAFGAVAGDLASGLVLSPGAGSFYNEFFQQIEATVTGIKFTVDLTTNAAGDTPTSFAVSILDSFTFAIPTTGFADTLLMFNIDGSNTSYVTGVSTGDTAGVTATVPDTDSTVVLVLGALLVLGFAQRRKSLPMAA